MTTALAPRSAAPVAIQTPQLDTLTVARMLAESGFFGEVKDAGKALAKILAGQELGIGPIASLMGIYYQQGKVTYSANVMATAVKKHPQYDYRVKTIGTTECAIEFFERSAAGWESLGVSSFTEQEADTAGLLTGPNKHNWKSYRRNMLFSRAMSNGCKWFCPGIFGGVAPYTPDELGDEVIMSADGDMTPVARATVIDADPAPTPKAEDFDGEAFGARPTPSNWTQMAEDKWSTYLRAANEVGAPIPDKPAADATREAIVTALKTLADNVVNARANREHQLLIAQLREVIQAAEASGIDLYEVPSDVDLLPDDDIREMIISVQQAIPTEPAVA